jgi:hypothetical protein
MRRLIYTAVFGGYDRVYSPLCPDAGADYVIVTDDPDTRVPGWRTLYADGSGFPTAKAANLYHRALIHRVLTGYDVSLYVDGNVRLIGDTRSLFRAFEASGAALSAHRHHRRSTVAEEVETVIAMSLVADPSAARREYDDYIADGFPDNLGLMENGVILKNHRHPELDAAMELWWRQFSVYLTRDQLSLPYVLWKTGLSVDVIPGTFLTANPLFAHYPHLADASHPAWLIHLNAKSHESALNDIAFRVLRRMNEGWGRMRGAWAPLGPGHRL